MLLTWLIKMRYGNDKLPLSLNNRFFGLAYAKHSGIAWLTIKAQLVLKSCPDLPLFTSLTVFLGSFVHAIGPDCAHCARPWLDPPPLLIGGERQIKGS